MIIGLVTWIVVGIIVGFIGSKLVNLCGEAPFFGIAAACTGGLVAAILYTLISDAGITAWNPWSVLSAAIGSTIGAVPWHAVRARYITHERFTVRKSY